ncbi:MAG TPA: leucine-rich repeat domain-containing protein [Hyphomicrobiales bacterium]|nr:leucine-rich repeat domain-containing protein [Hyphomicrobiales bacterium]
MISVPRRFSLALVLPLAAAVLLTACKNNPYTVTFNENVVYSPNDRSNEGPLRDPALQGCLNQVLAGNPAVDVGTLTLLACPGAGVQSLDGIAALPRLEQLELSGNRISDVSQLALLKNLRVLSLRDNQVANIGVLDSMPSLRFVSLQGNNRLPCRQLDSLETRLGNTLGRPERCL